MSVSLPVAASAYFEADKAKDGSAVSACFTEDALVTDEGKTYRGRQSIREWKEKSSTKYSYTVEPFEVERVGEKTLVTAHVVGDFPGSPIRLRYFFGLRGDEIASLEIKS